MVTLVEIKNLLAVAHKPERAEHPGMVWQIWEDGELTLQKSGDLLWQRNLHCIVPGLQKALPLDVMPVQEERHGYAFIENEAIGQAIRAKMEEYWQQG